MLEVTIVNLKQKLWYAGQKNMQFKEETEKFMEKWKQTKWPLKNINLQSYSNSKM